MATKNESQQQAQPQNDVLNGVAIVNFPKGGSFTITFHNGQSTRRYCRSGTVIIVPVSVAQTLINASEESKWNTRTDASE